jgi:hypothetical protein
MNAFAVNFVQCSDLCLCVYDFGCTAFVAEKPAKIVD